MLINLYVAGKLIFFSRKPTIMRTFLSTPENHCWLVEYLRSTALESTSNCSLQIKKQKGPKVVLKFKGKNKRGIRPPAPSKTQYEHSCLKHLSRAEDRQHATKEHTQNEQGDGGWDKPVKLTGKFTRRANRQMVYLSKIYKLSLEMFLRGDLSVCSPRSVRPPSSFSFPSLSGKGSTRLNLFLRITRL